MGNKKVSKDYISEFFDENKKVFKDLQERFVSVLMDYTSLPVDEEDIDLELSKEQIMLSMGDSRWIYQEKSYGWGFQEEAKEETDGNAV